MATVFYIRCKEDEIENQLQTMNSLSIFILIDAHTSHRFFFVFFCQSMSIPKNDLIISEWDYKEFFVVVVMLLFECCEMLLLYPYSFE